MKKILLGILLMALLLSPMVLSACSEKAEAEGDSKEQQLIKEKTALEEQLLQQKITNAFNQKYNGMVLEGITEPVERRLIWFNDGTKAYVAEAYVDADGNILLTLPLQAADLPEKE